MTAADSLGPGEPDTVDITASTAGDYATAQIMAASDIIQNLSADQLAGRRGVAATAIMTARFRVASRLIGQDQTALAARFLARTLERTDGCIANGTPDGPGLSRDLITDCGAQEQIYYDIK